MRRRGTIWALAVLLACGVTGAQAAVVHGDLTGRSGAVDGGVRAELADDHGHHHDGGHRGGHGGGHWDRGGGGHWDRGRDWGRHGWDRGDWGRHHGHSDLSLFFGFAGPRYYDYGPGPSCQPFVQNGYWYGRPAQIGSTLCYDAWGNSYVVDGSSYVIQFLDGYP